MASTEHSIRSQECQELRPGLHRPTSSPLSPPSRPEVPRFGFAELFAGLGGFRVALEALGGECRFASEIERFTRQMWRGDRRGGGWVVFFPRKLGASMGKMFFLGGPGQQIQDVGGEKWRKGGRRGGDR